MITFQGAGIIDDLVYKYDAKDDGQRTGFADLSPALLIVEQELCLGSMQCSVQSHRSVNTVALRCPGSVGKIQV